mmetsp:Transcript_154553/g.280877  ORF Transcript_154553/g.280877 Transcript_154553/m.280877 type:complete len:81 (+) Transcript_154553:995-1237(+)
MSMRATVEAQKFGPAALRASTPLAVLVAAFAYRCLPSSSVLPPHEKLHRQIRSIILGEAAARPQMLEEARKPPWLFLRPN